MKRVRTLVLLLLLLTVPFQAAMGAGSMLCAAMMQHGSGPQNNVPEGHMGAMADSGHHAPVTVAGDHAQVANDHQSAPSQAGSHDASDTSGKCKTCNECSSPAAPVLLAAANTLPPDTPLRVAALVDAQLVSRTIDGLFRPPRTILV